jgi:hypothetical protein
MTILLNPRLWIALALAAVLGFTHFTAYRAGKGVVRAEWDKDKAARMAQALEAEQAARQREQQLVAERKKVEDRYVQDKRKADIAAAGARAELERLRIELAAPRGAAPADPAAAPRADGRAGLESELLGHCAKALVGMAQEADRLETVVVGLQQYVRQVCVRP